MVAIIPPASIFNNVYIPEIQNKQQQFEDYVANTLFPQPKYTSLKLNSELRKQSQAGQQQTLQPHLYLKDTDNNKKFLVECKYRGGCIANSFQLAQSLTFKHSGNKEDIPYFFVLGVGGTAANPAQVFLINLQNCVYLVLYKRHLKGKEIKDLQMVPSSTLWL